MTEEKKRPALPRVPTRKILDTLRECYPDAHCELDFRNPFELLVATILSAQATDKKVNQITGPLFAKYPGPEELGSLTQAQLEQEIREIGLYKNKAKNILETCRLLMDRHGGDVPDRMEDLVQLPGVGRKTANVVLSNAFGVPAMAVDTHVLRVSNRIGLAAGDDPLVVEQQLTKRIPKREWSDAHHWLIWHGRRVCDARNPKCGTCALTEFCRHYRGLGRAGTRKKTGV
ncbi:endonuclease III [Tumebacillus flagellatus]|uniref:Endonuclease III n=1 Tax=Tumebacillus flagellatus TaxID=1157490 RepID=A0A074LRF1_9BACL|nr:endonuclease III [Tumebacillus flagellatus]KEO83055.1 endonuclease III [Tumebacillus flagellatus]